MTRRRALRPAATAIVALIAAVLMVSAGVLTPAGTAQASPTGGHLRPGSLVRYVKTGGFAYTHQVLSIDKLGRVTATATDGSQHHAQLTPAEVTSVRRAVGRLAGYDGRRYMAPGSADTFVYQVTTAIARVTYEDGATRPAVVGEAGDLLNSILARTLGGIR